MQHNHSHSQAHRLHEHDAHDGHDEQALLLSALLDGELPDGTPALEQALQAAHSQAGQQTWQLYQLVGDVLRSPDLAQGGQHDILSGLRTRLAQERTPTAATHALPTDLPPPVSSTSSTSSASLTPQALAGRTEAANDAVFRWKLAAGFASLAAVATVGWHVWTLPSQAAGAAAQWSAAPAGTTAASVMAVANPSSGAVVLRDPRLDALLASQPQYASRAGVQMPAEFLRNASLARSSAANTASTASTANTAHSANRSNTDAGTGSRLGQR
ncbi:MAG: sigma-E factor negative regulatory protein [Comamonas sp.]|nr:sigma-E factor negative regulatory protein [Comamonas sp.]